MQQCKKTTTTIHIRQLTTIHTRHATVHTRLKGCYSTALSPVCSVHDSTGGLILTGEIRIIRRQTCASATFPITASCVLAWDRPPQRSEAGDWPPKSRHGRTSCFVFEVREKDTCNGQCCTAACISSLSLYKFIPSHRFCTSWGRI